MSRYIAAAALALAATAEAAQTTTEASDAEYLTFKAGAWGGAVAGVVLLVGVIAHRAMTGRRDGYEVVEQSEEDQIELDVRGV